ncbi:MAG: DUF362 domain-containing protein [Coriobacteriia bacterium]|nr:DUF362 domain-containing protein [Coriobacteriia bacterium]
MNSAPSNAAEDSLNSKDGVPNVYMTTDISPQGLNAVFQALNTSPNGKVAVKLHSGESAESNYLRPELIKNFIQSLNATIVETNTAYGGSRADTASHRQLVKDHGFTDIADVDIMDGEGIFTLSVPKGTNINENYVGKSFPDYDCYVVLSHFKGHMMGGFGGAVKNTSIGLASAQGKSWIHSAGKQTSGFSMDTPQENFLESMAEAALSVYDYLDGNMLFINIMNRLSIDCDCAAKPTEPDMHDIGILAGMDPVALDQACVDLVYAAEDGASVIERIESRKGIHTLEHAEEIGLGMRQYNLVQIDG